MIVRSRGCSGVNRESSVWRTCVAELDVKWNVCSQRISFELLIGLHVSLEVKT